MSTPSAARAIDLIQSNETGEIGLHCFHCGLAMPVKTHWQVSIDLVLRPMCCPGCQAVAQSIVDNGCADYYQTRTEFSATVADTLTPPQLQLYDTAEIAGQSSVD